MTDKKKRRMKRTEVYKAKAGDESRIAALSVKLWPELSKEELTGEFAAFLKSDESAVFLAKEDGKDIGFAHCQLRQEYVEGTESSPVGYLEGIFVEETAQRRGIGRTLVSACEQWAVQKGCREFASDCELDNTESLQFHLGVGFAEANRLICFAKRLPNEPENRAYHGQEEKTDANRNKTALFAGDDGAGF